MGNQRIEATLVNATVEPFASFRPGALPDICTTLCTCEADSVVAVACWPLIVSCAVIV